MVRLSAAARGVRAVLVSWWWWILERVFGRTAPVIQNLRVDA
jgi:hypothetical protein